MKSVLISIRPKWCEKIASGEKSVEIRKTKPKLETPFKVYIYCTRPKRWFKYSSCGCASDESLWLSDGKVEMCDGFKYWCDGGDYTNLNGKVIGEFVCDSVFLWNSDIHDDDTITLEETCELSCLSADALLKYADGYFYGWHISDLKIYDKPLRLTEFRKTCVNELYCESCGMHSENTGACGNAALQLTRPPQSWCYVEEAT